MNRLIIILFLIFFAVKLALCTSIIVYAPAYKNQSITWKKKIDYITNTNEIIAQEITDSNGYAKLYFDFKENELTEISIGRSHGMLYVDTSNHEYNVYFPKDSIIDEASLKKSEVQIVFLNLEKNNINSLILDFNNELDYFLYGDTSKIIRMAKHSNEFQDSLNNFKILLSNRYKTKKIKYLHNYIRYEIAILEQLAHQNKGDYFKAYLYENYLKRNKINYKNDAYMQFFNLFYSDVFKIGGVELNDQIKFAINNYNELQKLIEIIQSCKYFSSPQLSELAIIKGLYDAYNSPSYLAENILLFLKKISIESNWQAHKILAINCLKELTKFNIGSSCPELIVKDQNNQVIKIHELKGKYTYVNFFASWNYKSLHEMEIIKQFKENYGFVNYISINLENNEEAYNNFIKSNLNYQWPICYPLNKQKIVDDFQLDHLPSYLLIDPNGNISQFPALPPSPLSKGYNSTTIDKTFFTIKKNSREKKPFKIGKKD
jgi:thiol-disulfide isomerase/thioredoxin